MFSYCCHGNKDVSRWLPNSDFFIYLTNTFGYPQILFYMKCFCYTWTTNERTIKNSVLTISNLQKIVFLAKTIVSRYRISLISSFVVRP